MEWAHFALETCGAPLPFFCDDISQRAAYTRESGLSPVVPALLRRAKLIICGPALAWRPDVPEELLAAHGFPVFAQTVEATPVTKCMLSLLETGGLSQTHAISMIGNSMHHAAVGSMFLNLLLGWAHLGPEHAASEQTASAGAVA